MTSDLPFLAGLGFGPGEWKALAALAPAGADPARVARVARVDRGWASAWRGDGATARVVTSGGAGAPGGPGGLPAPGGAAGGGPAGGGGGGLAWGGGGGGLAVGDWVVLDETGERLSAVLPRRSVLARRAADGSAAPQVLAANVDVVGLCHALSAPPKPRRLERELVLAFDSGATPLVLLTKADLAGDLGAAARLVAVVAPSVEVQAVSARRGDGLADLQARLAGARGLTLALLGASGVGKSTLVNALAGAAVQRTAEVRASDQRGRHTTTATELVRLPGGGLLVDTPGLRALALWSEGQGLARAFADVVSVGERCRFADCTHRSEPDCAVREAVAEGRLDAARVASWQRLSAELHALAEERRASERARGSGRGRRR